jgi:transposase
MGKIFAGLDVSQQTTAVCIAERDGNIILETTAPTNPSAIAAVLKPYRGQLERVGHESGQTSPWLHKQLLKHGLPAICLDARQTRAALSAQRNKTDRNDARGIAVLMSRGFDGAAHVKSTDAQRLQSLVLFRNTLTRRARDVDRTLGASLKGFGAKLTKIGERATIVCPRGGRDSELLRYAASMLRARAAIRAEAASLEALIKEYAFADYVCRRLMTVPGVGPLVAVTFKAAIDDPARFSASRDVGAYFGLTPRRFQSGKSDYHGHISKFGSAEVRGALFQAAHSLLVCTKRSSKLRSWGLALAKTRGLTHARTSCARKLAVVLHRMWITDRDFVAGNGGA